MIESVVGSVNVSGPLDYDAWENATKSLRPLLDTKLVVSLEGKGEHFISVHDSLRRDGDTILKERHISLFSVRYRKCIELARK